MPGERTSRPVRRSAASYRTTCLTRLRTELSDAAPSGLIPPLVARIRAEEALLRSQFGGEYDAYRSRTSRLIPGLY